MSPTEFAEMMQRITTAYPRQQVSPAMQTEYWRGLQDLDYRAADLAVSVWIRGSKWFPTVADLRDLTLGEPTPLTSPQEAERRRAREQALAKQRAADDEAYNAQRDAAVARYGAALESGDLDAREVLRSVLVATWGQRGVSS